MPRIAPAIGDPAKFPGRVDVKIDPIRLPMLAGPNRATTTVGKSEMNPPEKKPNRMPNRHRTPKDVANGQISSVKSGASTMQIV